jgi:alpha-tubulin suppressor-like RCC1 family protein
VADVQAEGEPSAAPDAQTNVQTDIADAQSDVRDETPDGAIEAESSTYEGGPAEEASCSWVCVGSSKVQSCGLDAGSSCQGLCSDGNCLQVETIATGASESCAVLSNGQVYCWGDNEFGNLGAGVTETSSVTPLPVQTTPASDVIAGGSHACARLNYGGVACWGNYGDFDWNPSGGALDTGVPTPIDGVSGAIALAAGNSSACALLSDQTIRCWGHNFAGQLGDGTTNDATTAVAVAGLTDVTGIAVGAGHACAIMADTSVRCWGQNFDGQLGDGTGVDSVSPVTVAGLTGVVQLAAGWDHTCALLNDRTVACWGENGFGQLAQASTGPETCAATVCSKAPVPISGLSGVAQLTSGQSATCALLLDGTVRCWGLNYAGELGDGICDGPDQCGGTSCSESPVPVLLTGATTIRCQETHCCAIVSDGSVQCWGDNGSGELGTSTPPVSDTSCPNPISDRPVAVQW